MTLFDSWRKGRGTRAVAIGKPVAPGTGIYEVRGLFIDRPKTPMYFTWVNNIMRYHGPSLVKATARYDIAMAQEKEVFT